MHQITSHNSTHSRIVDEIAPAPRLKDSIVLQKMRQKVLESLPRGPDLWELWPCARKEARDKTNTMPKMAIPKNS